MHIAKCMGAILAMLVLIGCAEDPALSYGQALNAQQCEQMYQSELTRWRSTQATGKPADQAVTDFFTALSGGIGLYQGEELFKRRRAVCLERVGRYGASLIQQPGYGGNARVYACRRGGGVLQGGTAICPGH